MQPQVLAATKVRSAESLKPNPNPSPKPNSNHTSAISRPGAGASMRARGRGGCSARMASATPTRARNGGCAESTQPTRSCRRTRAILMRRSRSCRPASTFGRPTSCVSAHRSGCAPPRCLSTHLASPLTRRASALLSRAVYNAKLHIDEDHPMSRERIPSHLQLPKEEL